VTGRDRFPLAHLVLDAHEAVAVFERGMVHCGAWSRWREALDDLEESERIVTDVAEGLESAWCRTLTDWAVGPGRATTAVDWTPVPMHPYDESAW
jgi:hypothetical protein